MTNEALLDPHTQKVIKRYTAIYNIFFKYSLFLIPIVFAIGLASFLQSRDVNTRISSPKQLTPDSYTVQNGIYKAARVSDEVGSMLGGKGVIKILGGELQATGDVLIGRNNLITLAGIVLPEQPYVINFNFSGGLSTFEQDYSVDDLIRVLNNWILSLPPESKSDVNSDSIISSIFFKKDLSSTETTNMEEILDALQKRRYFTNPTLGNITTPKKQTNGTFITQYKLSCLGKVKLYKGFCDKNLENFLQNIPYAPLDNSWNDIFEIASSLKEDTYIKAFCANIMYNVFKQPYPSSELDNLMHGVCSPYNDRYSKIKDFLKIENQLKGIISEDIINGNLDANLFKLTSVQQKILLQQRSNIADTNTILAYLKFFDGLIHQGTMKIPQFYIDASYYFNNIYLKKILKHLSASSINPTIKNDVSTIFDTISSINKGNEPVGIIGLDKMIKNKNLTTLVAKGPDSLAPIIKNFDQVFSDYLKLFPEIIANDIKTDDTTKTARFIGVLQSIEKEGGEGIRLSLIAQFDYTGGNFVISSLRLPENRELDGILGEFMKNNKNRTFVDTLEFIKQNASYSHTDISMCDVLKETNNVGVEDCSTTNASILIKDNKIQLTLENNFITSFQTDNPQRNEYFSRMIKTYTKISPDRIGNIIAGVVASSDIKPEDPLGSIESEKIAIINKFKTFLKVEPSDITKKDGKRIVTFQLQKYTFATVVDIQKNYKLSPLVVEVNQQIITIPGFSLMLIPFSQTTINQFVGDPLTYIKNIDTVAYQKITEAIQNKTP